MRCTCIWSWFWWCLWRVVWIEFGFGCFKIPRRISESSPDSVWVSILFSESGIDVFGVKFCSVMSLEIRFGWGCIWVLEDSKKDYQTAKEISLRVQVVKKVEGKNGINGTAIAHSGEPALHTLPKPMDACERCKIQQFFTIAASGLFIFHSFPYLVALVSSEISGVESFMLICSEGLSWRTCQIHRPSSQF